MSSCAAPLPRPLNARPYAAVISLVSYALRPPEDDHARIPAHLASQHVSIEVHHCR
ncbi:hypothetical protein [Azospirillum sp. TSO22-1]|uniref:hypothetical protein n=1 Tax=Azospirillum sp. TSO22-1 TaxID=716789 RepID=UPI001304C498|nr:hypothetical protein [Azospirillum sp. TSO22-1]